jgi:hypothetical protein
MKIPHCQEEIGKVRVKKGAREFGMRIKGFG